MKYIIADRNHDEITTVRAETIEAAAGVASRKINGRTTIANRTTGDAGKSGFFQSYRSLPQRLGGGLNSTGNPFHVRED